MLFYANRPGRDNIEHAPIWVALVRKNRESSYEKLGRPTTKKVARERVRIWLGLTQGSSDGKVEQLCSHSWPPHTYVDYTFPPAVRTRFERIA